MSRSPREQLVRLLACALSAFTLVEVNYPHLAPQSQLAIFALLGLCLCFLVFPLHPRLVGSRAAALLDVVLALAASAACLAGPCFIPAGNTQPKMSWSISLGSNPVRSSTAEMAADPSSGAVALQH